MYAVTLHPYITLPSLPPFSFPPPPSPPFLKILLSLSTLSSLFALQRPDAYYCFSDFERVGWINTILAQLWPNVNSAVSQQFRELLGPLLWQNKPSWIASLKLFRSAANLTKPIPGCQSLCSRIKTTHIRAIISCSDRNALLTALWRRKILNQLHPCQA